MLKFGEVAGSIRCFEGHKCDQFVDPNGKTRIASSHIFNDTRSLDVSWMALAAEKYNISKNMRDYIIAEVPIVTVNVPNRNLDCFPFSEISSFNVDYGRLTYASFIGKPTYKDHDNKDPWKAKGVHLDATLQRIAGNRYKIAVLTAWDRTKDTELVNEMLSGKRNGFSMGAIVQSTSCSYPGCTASSTNGRINCAHMDNGRNKGAIVNGHLVYEMCHGITYFESSSVTEPADHTALHKWQKPWA